MGKDFITYIVYFLSEESVDTRAKHVFTKTWAICIVLIAVLLLKIQIQGGTALEDPKQCPVSNKSIM